MRRRRNKEFFQYTDNSRKFASNSRNDAFLESYEQLYTRRLLEKHRFSDEFIPIVTQYLSLEKRKQLLNELLPYVIHNQNITEYEKENAKDFLEGREQSSDFNTFICPILQVSDALLGREKLLPLLLKHFQFCSKPSESKSFSERLARISSTFHLTKTDTAILLFFFIIDTNDLLSSLYNSWSKRDIIKGISLCIASTVNTVNKCLSPSGNLRKFGLIAVNKRFSADLEIAPSVSDFFLMNKDGDIFDTLVKTKKGISFPLESFPVHEKERELCLSLLKSSMPVQILLHGSEGSGKTEFAKALADQAKKKAYFYERDKKDDEDVFTTLTLLDSSIASSPAVLIIDEAEDMLDAGGKWLTNMMSGSKDDKARINTFLDQVHTPIIWIVNNTEGIIPSTRRRFTFSVEFTPLKKDKLQEMAEKAVAALRISTEAKKKAVQLAGNWNLTGAAISNMKTTLEELSKTYKEEKDLIPFIETLFEANGKLVSGKKRKKNITESCFSIDVLNVSIPASKIVSTVNIISNGNEENRENKQGLRILFHGIPGSGKTELARFIAKECGKDLDIRRASDILSAYVGEAEKNIARMFHEAEKSGDILLIDEADSFLYNRGKAVRSWEITQVNEFLTCMEEFKGILICTTNSMPNLDTAVIRRFQVKAEFKAMRQDQTEKLFTAFFPGISVTDDNKRKLLEGGPYVPGDFSAVSRASDYLCSENESKEDCIVKALIAEASHRQYNKQPIGFSSC